MSSRLPQIIELLQTAISEDDALFDKREPRTPEPIRHKFELAYTEALTEQRRQSMEVF